MLRKSCPNSSRKPPGTSRSSLWPSWSSFWASWAGALSGAPQNRSRRLSRRPPPLWGSFWLHFWTPRTSKNVVFVWRVCHFSKKRGVRKNTLKNKTWLSWNGKRVRRESVQALQARREQREQQEQPEAERQNHQEEQGESGEGRPRIETASAYYRLQPCSGATRPRRRFELGASRSRRVA